MNINTSDKKYGLVLPKLTALEDPQDFSRALEEDRDLIDRVTRFLEKNGAEHIACTGQVTLIDQINSRDSNDPIIGLIFYGPRELAQRVAAAFPNEKIVSYEGETIPVPGTAGARAAFIKQQVQRLAGPKP